MTPIGVHTVMSQPLTATILVIRKILAVLCAASSDGNSTENLCTSTTTVTSLKYYSITGKVLVYEIYLSRSTKYSSQKLLITTNYFLTFDA